MSKKESRKTGYKAYKKNEMNVTMGSLKTFVLIEENQKECPLIENYLELGENDYEVVTKIDGDNVSISYWQTVLQIIKTGVLEENLDTIIICDGNSQFSSTYSRKILIESITQANLKGADFLCGELGWYRNAVAVNDNLFWIDEFADLKFTVFFRRAFDRILDFFARSMDLNDIIASRILEQKFVCFPFLSIPKESSKSLGNTIDALRTKRQELSIKTYQRLNTLGRIKTFLQNNTESSNLDINNKSIPTYILNLPERKERRAHIEKEFDGRIEFDIKFTQAIKHKIGAVGLWLSIRGIVTEALESNEDIIIICEDDHCFTKEYSKSSLYSNIISAERRGTELLIGGAGGFGTSIQISKKQFWVNWFYCTQFIVLYKSVFQKILDAEYDDGVTADGLLSKIVLNKMVCFPFISKQKDFGYSDVTVTNNTEGYIEFLFQITERRFSVYDAIAGDYAPRE